MSTYHDILDTVTAVGAGFGLPLAAWAALQATKAAGIARAQLQAGHRPFLLHVPYAAYPDGVREIEVEPRGKARVSGEGHAIVDVSDGRFVVPVRNVGRGVALFDLYRFGVAGCSEVFRYSGAIPPGERIWLGGKVTEGEAANALASSVPPREYVSLGLHYLDYLKTESQFAVIVLGRSADPKRWVAKTTRHELADRAWVRDGEQGKLV